MSTRMYYFLLYDCCFRPKFQVVTYITIHRAIYSIFLIRKIKFQKFEYDVLKTGP